MNGRASPSCVAPADTTIAATSAYRPAIAGRRPLNLALDQGQKIAQRAGDNQKKG